MTEHDAFIEFWHAFHSLEAASANWAGVVVHNALVDRLKAADAEVRKLLGAPVIDPRVEMLEPPEPLTSGQQAAVEPWPWEEK